MGTYQTALGALGDPTRRLIFEHLARAPRAVGELAGELPISRPAVSQHLKALKDAGLVIDRAVGTRRIYHVDPTGVATLRAYLDQVWNDALAAFQAFVEDQHDPTGPADPTDLTGPTDPTGPADPTHPTDQPAADAAATSVQQEEKP